ncbi:MAG: hypothetical protein NTV49_14525, partial [Kiritimatiellaeota bacterium]|nr:hypothetical protein [Kiritimatiellota bacterium]
MQLKSIVRLLCCGMLGWSLPTAFSQERHRLYTVTNPADTGGIKGHMSSPYKPIQQILAMPPNEPRFVYEGKVLGAARQDFLFESLPMALYDLLVVYEDDFYEGLEL